MILRQLRLIGLAADVAADGREALTLWRTGDFALLLTDLHMRQMDGYALATAIRAEEVAGHRTPIIALTANALRDEEQRCLAVGIDAYLTKPVRLAQLKASIEAWLGPTPPRPLTESPAAPAPAPPAMDLDVLRAIVGDHRAVIDEVLHAYRESAALSSAELAQAITAGSGAAAGNAAHKLKSAARSIGALRPGELCARIEQAAEARKADQLKVLLPRFEAESAAVFHFLDSR